MKDKNGVELQIGDEVISRGKVVEIHESTGRIVAVVDGSDMRISASLVEKFTPPDALKPQTMRVNPHTEELRKAADKLRNTLKLICPLTAVASDRLACDVFESVSLDASEALKIVDDVIRECS